MSWAVVAVFYGVGGALVGVLLWENRVPEGKRRLGVVFWPVFGIVAIAKVVIKRAARLIREGREL